MSTNDELQELKQNPAYQMWLLNNTWQRLLRRALDPFGLTHVQYTVLASIAYLSKLYKPVTQADICRFASADTNMVSSVVRSLMSRGLVERLPHPSDKRAFRLALTSEGLAKYEAARAVARPLSQAFYAPLGEETGELARLLEKLNKAAEASEVPLTFTPPGVQVRGI